MKKEKESELTVAHAARRLRVGLDVVYALVWSGKLPGQKVDGHWRIPEAAVERRREALSERRRTRVRAPAGPLARKDTGDAPASMAAEATEG